MSNPLISVLLPTHNRADVLPYAIESILKGSEQRIEVLIVGDGCSDYTAEVVGSFKDERIQWFDFPKGKGFGYEHRNTVLAKAKGTYIAFMAHDDLWLKDHLEKLLIPFNSDEELELSYSRPLYVSPQGYISSPAFNLNDINVAEIYFNKEQNLIPASAFLYKRSCLDKYGYWDATILSGGDWDFYVRVIEGGLRQRFSFVSEPTCLHFKANWRTKDQGPNQLRMWREWYLDYEGLPAELHINIPEGEREQDVVWRSMQQNSTFWVAALRNALITVYDARLFSEGEAVIKAAWEVKHLREVIEEVNVSAEKRIAEIDCTKNMQLDELRDEIKQLSLKLKKGQGLIYNVRTRIVRVLRSFFYR